MTTKERPRGIPFWAALGMVGLGALSVVITVNAVQRGDTTGMVLGCIMLLGALTYLTGYAVQRWRR